MNAVDSQGVRNRRLVALAMLCALFLPGCGYPEVSPKTYEIAKALYAVCNLQRDDRLPIVIDLIEQSAASGEITRREASWLNAIVAEAESGRWNEAQLEARRLMEDQVTR